MEVTCDFLCDQRIGVFLSFVCCHVLSDKILQPMFTHITLTL